MIMPLTIFIVLSSCLKDKEEPTITPLPADYSVQGTLTVNSRNLTICARDWDAIDGDRIKILFNGKVIAADVEMTATNKCWELKNLPVGDNWIGIVALDQGMYGSASPRIEINDGIRTQGFNIQAYINQPGAYTIKVQL